MPENRPGRGVYVTNGTGAPINHGAPHKNATGHVGIAVKQKGYDWKTPVADVAKIADGEEFFLITKGVVLCDFVSGVAKGDPLYIISATGVLTESANSGANPKFGRCYEIQGQRNVPTGKMRVDLDGKDSFV